MRGLTLGLAMIVWIAGASSADAQSVWGLPSYTLLDPAGQLVLATEAGRFYVRPEADAGCASYVAQQPVLAYPDGPVELVLAPADRPNDADNPTCRVLVGARLQGAPPCAINDAGLCDLALDPGGNL